MLDVVKIQELRNTADSRLAQLMVMKSKLETEMSTLQEQFNLRQRQVNITIQQIIEAQATLVSFNTVLGDVTPVPVVNGEVVP